MANSYVYQSLGELFEFSSGLSKSADQFGFGNPFITFKDVFDNCYLPGTPSALVNTSEREIEKCSVRRGDVLLTRTSETINELGMSSVALQDYPRSTFNGFTKRLRPKIGTELNPEFLVYAFRSPAFRSGIYALSTMSTRASLNNEMLAKLRIPVPELKAQEAIGAVLYSFDRKIELNHSINETLDEMAQALFKSWFVDFDPIRAKAEGRSTNLPPALDALFPSRFVHSELGEIPEGWEVGNLGVLGQLAIGGDWGEELPFEGGVEAVCLRGVDLEHLRREGEANAPRRWFKPNSLERRTLDELDVLIAGSGAGPTGRSLWMCPVLLQSISPCIYSNFCKRFRCGAVSEAVYLDAWLHVMRESGQIWDYVNGTSIPNLDAGALLGGKEIPIPPIAVLDTYYQFVRSIWDRKYSKESRTLADLRDSLVPKLVSGEIRLVVGERV